MAKIVEKGSTKMPLTIEFSVEELDTLAAILSVVGGSPDGSYRKYADSISQCLDEGGYWYSNSPALKKVDGTVDFSGGF